MTPRFAGVLPSPPSGALGAARAVGLALCFGATLFTTPLLAENPARIAEDLFNAARAAYQRGEFSAAARAFEEAGRRVPRPETSYNAGLAWEAGGEPLRAANALRAALDAEGLVEALAQDAERRLARLAMPFGLIRLSGPKTATAELPGVQTERLPFASFAEPGAHTLTITYAHGQRELRRVVVVQGHTLTLVFSEPADALPASHAETASPPVASASSWQLVTGIVALGAAGVAAGAGVALGVRGLSARDDFEASGRKDPQSRQEALSLRTYANVAFGSALACSLAGVVLLSQAPVSRRAASAFVTVSPSSVTLRGRF